MDDPSVQIDVAQLQPRHFAGPQADGHHEADDEPVHRVRSTHVLGQRPDPPARQEVAFELRLGRALGQAEPRAGRGADDPVVDRVLQRRCERRVDVADRLLAQTLPDQLDDPLLHLHGGDGADAASTERRQDVAAQQGAVPVGGARFDLERHRLQRCRRDHREALA